jgi:hypothetical protein
LTINNKPSTHHPLEILFTTHFNPSDTKKLTTAPTVARITVFKISGELIFAATVNAVPETVPVSVPYVR